jgi:type III restriction enzyme
MIINSQAFNAKGNDARRIYMKLDEFRSRRPIDIIANTNPIIIIDEPQSVEGKQTKENLKAFNPLMTLRYSATHKSDSIYNMIYRLDAIDAYNKRLVKKIAVKGISETGTSATDSYVYLESINLSQKAPSATIQFDVKGASGIKKKSVKAGIGFSLYDNSGELSEYKDGFVVKYIDGRDNSVEFINGLKIYAGDVMGKISEQQLRRIQIRETILSHIKRERQLFNMGIKVLSLFFIDEVANYKEYDSAGQPKNGIFARMFEEEYKNIIDNIQRETCDEDYMRYLKQISAESTHAGYFSIDKKGHIVNRVAGDDKKSKISNDIDAYDLIMKNKELLLERDPKKSPVRFIFSHSALREGWDNPNVFQICTLKQSNSEVRKRQEVGRGLRLCVNQYGERMDENVLGSDVHNVNVLTVIASESYDSFAKGLQAEIAETVVDRTGNTYDIDSIKPENARSNNVNQEKHNSKEFKSLWSRINSKSVYVVDFDTDELVRNAIASLNSTLRVSRIYFKVESGQMKDIKSKEELLSGVFIDRETSENYEAELKPAVNSGVKYDLVGRLVEETGLTRKAIIRILTGIDKNVFEQFKNNPEEFIMKAAALINAQKEAAIFEHMNAKLKG